MQSPGPTYQGANIGIDNYTGRAYDNANLNSHISSHQAENYITYQDDQQNRYLDSSYNSGAAIPGSTYGTNNPYNNSSGYANCGPLYGQTGGRHCYTNRPVNSGIKPYWSDHAIPQNNAQQYNRLHHMQQQNPGSHMPPPPLRSPPQSGNGYNVQNRQAASPHNWNSPGVMQSPRGTPSPLAHTTRSPFSPPPPPLTQMGQNKSTIIMSSGAPGQVPGSSPLQSLQKMVLVDQDSSDSSVSRGSYDTNQMSGTPPTSMPQCSQKSHRTLETAAHDPESPYPTYYNLDQNRLCTPPRSSPITGPMSTYNPIPESVKFSQQLSSKGTVSEANKFVKTIVQQYTENSSSSSGEMKESRINSNSISAKVENGAMSDCDQLTSNPISNENTQNDSISTSNPLNTKRCADAADSYYSSNSSSENLQNLTGNGTRYEVQKQHHWAKNNVTITAGDGLQQRQPNWKNTVTSATKNFYPHDRSDQSSQPFHAVSYHASQNNAIPPQHQQRVYNNTTRASINPVGTPWHETVSNDPIASTSTASSETTPVKKKRGRPHGSKNKPKNPTPTGTPVKDATTLFEHEPQKDAVLDVKVSRKPRKTQKLEIGTNTVITLNAQNDEQLTVLPQYHPSSLSNRKNTGPIVHVDKNSTKRFSYSIVNVQKRFEDEKDSKKPKSHVDRYPGNIPNRRHSLTKKKLMTLTQQMGADSIVKDTSWVCVLCKQGSHHKGLGDLFGPYFIGSLQTIDLNECNVEHGEFSGMRSKLITDKRKKSDSSESLLEKKSNINRLAENSSLLKECNEQKPIPQCEVWFHEDCLIWSSGVYIVAHRIRNIDDVVKDSLETICCACKFSGATLGCLSKACLSRFHYLCAKEKGCVMNEENFSIHCSKHKAKES